MSVETNQADMRRR